MDKDKNEMFNDENADVSEQTVNLFDAEDTSAAAEPEPSDGGNEKFEDAFKEISDDIDIINNNDKQKKGINISVGALVGVVVGCVAVATLAVFLIMNYIADQPKYGKAEGRTVATVDGYKITDADMGYYIYTEAYNQYYNIEGSNATGDLQGFDWEQDVDGRSLSDIIKENAYNNAIAETVTALKADEILTGEDAWTETNDAQIESTVDGYVTQFGEEGFNLRAKSMGISSANEYARMYTNVMKSQTVQMTVEEDLASYIPENVDLSQYTSDDRGSAKHVLITTYDANNLDPAETPEPGAVDEATGLATAQTVADQAKSGGDFDALMEQYNQDTGETTDGYTFRTGEMVQEFEDAAFALGIDEVSDPVKTSYGYHVIKRIAGFYELQNYWRSQADIKENRGNLDRISVKEIMDGVQEAGEQLQAEQEAASESSSSSSSSETDSSESAEESAATAAAE